jgi:hypothetical protein
MHTKAFIQNSLQASQTVYAVSRGKLRLVYVLLGPLLLLYCFATCQPPDSVTRLIGCFETRVMTSPNGLSTLLIASLRLHVG